MTPLMQQVFDALTDEPQTPGQIAEKVGRDGRHLCGPLAQLRKEKLAQRRVIFTGRLIHLGPLRYKEKIIQWRRKPQ